MLTRYRREESRFAGGVTKGPRAPKGQRNTPKGDSIRAGPLRRAGVSWAVREKGALRAEETADAEPWTSESIVFGAPQRAFCVCLPGGKQGLRCGQPMNKAMGLDF